MRPWITALLPAALLAGVENLTGCARILGIEEASCGSRFAGCPGFDGGGTNETSLPTERDSETATDEQSSGETTAVESGVTTVTTDTPSGDTQAGPDATAPPPTKPQLCSEYCESIEQACGEEYRQYSSIAACQTICNSLLLSETELAQAQVDTIECRLAQAAAAGVFTAEQDLLCESAGFTGGSECTPTPCQAFCGLLERGCSDLSPRPEFAGDETAINTVNEVIADCPAHCAEVDELDQIFVFDVPNGPHLECRFKHLTLASTDQRVPHCFHAVGLQGVCGP